MRRVLFTLLASGLAAASSAEANDAVVMPYRCALDDGRVTLAPSQERRYDIVGALDKQAITKCQRGGRCRTLTVHRFVVSCDGAGVAWMRVAAAIRRLRDEPAWIAAGRLNLVLPIDKSVAGAAPCIDPPEYGLGAAGSRWRATVGGCSDVTKAGAYEQVSLPSGFAPVAELGARLVLTTADGWLSPADMRGPLPGLRRVSASVGETMIAKVDAEALVEPIPGLEPYDPNYEPPATVAENWVTVVRSEPAHGMVEQANSASGGPASWAWLLTVMGLATGVLVMRARLTPAPDGARAGGSIFGLWPRARAGSTLRGFTQGGAAVAGLFEQTESVVGDLKGAGALREVLQSELAAVRQRLNRLEASAEDGDTKGAARKGPQFRALVRELERIRRIAESAAASLSRNRAADSLPQTSAEAYDVLGVNPDVRADVLKKIVDGLRMSWHPDHARGDEDRRERETRIRQINVAWDLINAKREAA